MLVSLDEDTASGGPTQVGSGVSAVVKCQALQLGGTSGATERQPSIASSTVGSSMPLSMGGLSKMSAL